MFFWKLFISFFGLENVEDSAASAEEDSEEEVEDLKLYINV